jgi:2'-5' RNA ligase
MRLFLGIELPDRVKRAVVSVADDLRARISSAAPRAVLRWVDANNLHITIWFLGEVKDDRADPLAAALREPLRTSSFHLNVGSAEAFPPSGMPRAIWLGLMKGTEPLQAIHRELGERLVPVGFEAERRAYSPHLTVARVKVLRPQEGRAVRAILASAPSEIAKTSVSAVTLFRSRLSSKGSQYESMLRVPLE